MLKKGFPGLLNILITIFISLMTTKPSYAGGIFDAIEQGNVKAVESLLEKDTELVHSRQERMRGHGSVTPLHAVLILDTLPEKTKIELISRLMEKKANIEARTQDYHTPLILAIGSDASPELIRVLVDTYHANIEAPGNQGNTPLISATQMMNVGQVQFLIEEKGADVNKTNFHGTTPLMEMSNRWFQPSNLPKRNKIVALLLNHGADMEGRDTWGRTAKYFMYSAARLWLHNLSVGNHDLLPFTAELVDEQIEHFEYTMLVEKAKRNKAKARYLTERNRNISECLSEGRMPVVDLQKMILDYLPKPKFADYAHFREQESKRD
jgi:ankyrin repeat protein